MPNNEEELLGYADADYKERYGFSDKTEYAYKTEKGLSENIIREISKIKNEPGWMLEKRLTGYKVFKSKPVPTWGADLSGIDFDDVYYYMKPGGKKEDAWDKVPDDIKRTFDKLGIPEAERKFFAGAEIQYDSEVVYGHVKEELEKQGVIFTDTDSAVKKYPELVKKYFGTVIPASDNKFAALNTAVFSGGSFIYVPKGVKVAMPLQAYFRINAEKAGQFERTLIIADEGADVTYLEGCTAPVYIASSLHSAVVEIIVHKDAHVRYVTIQNWSRNVYNLVTQRAFAYENAHMEWVDANIGCLVKGTQVFTNNNVKGIEEIKIGDKVYSLTQNFNIDSRKVTGVKENPPSDVYKLTTMNYREIIATSNHPVLVLRKEDKLNRVTWMPLGAIKKGDLIALSGNLPDRGVPYKILGFEHTKGTRIKMNIPSETNEDIMWLLGVYLGDGCTEPARANFAVPEYDPANKRIKSIIENIFGLKSTQYKVSIRVGSADFARFIRQIGFTGNAKTKTLPKWVYTLPISQKRAFIDGYWSADGNVKKGHKNMSITSVNLGLLEQIKSLAISCGMNATKISKWTRKEKKPLGKEEKEYTHYYLYFWEKKLDTPLYFVPVSKVEYAGKQITYDIEVEDSQNFIANGIIVHNSKVNMKYPSVYLKGRGSKGEILSVAVAGENQVQDSGGKMLHLAPDTTSKIISKSVSKKNGTSSYRGQLYISKDAANVKSTVRCDALLLDKESKTNTYPYMDVHREDATITHEAAVGKIGEEQLFYLMSRGLTEEEALTTVVLGFLDPLTKALPLEYSIELKRLIKLDTTNSVA